MNVGDLVSRLSLMGDVIYYGIVYAMDDDLLDVFDFVRYPSGKIHYDRNNLPYLYKPYTDEAILNLEYFDILDTLCKGVKSRTNIQEAIDIARANMT